MKKGIRYCLAVMLGSLMFSCSDDDGYSIGDMAIDLVTVHVEGNGLYSFTGDSWGTMFPAASQINWYTPREGERAILRFNPLFDNYSGYDVGIKAEVIHPVLTKTVEVMTPENEPEYGNHPAYMGQVWISGGYLNVEFYQKLPQEKKHRVSLVHAGTSPQVGEDGYVHLEYRYNTYGDTLSSRPLLHSMVCYNLNTLPWKEMKGIKLRVNDAVKGEQTVVFEKAGSDEKETGISRVNDLDLYEAW